MRKPKELLPTLEAIKARVHCDHREKQISMHCPVLTAFYICNIVLFKAYVNASSPHLIPDLRLNTVSEQSKITYIS